MDDDSGKARRNLIAVSTVVIVIVFLGVESLSFAGLTVKFGFESWRVWSVCYLFVTYFIFRYCLNPDFQKNLSNNGYLYYSDLEEFTVIFFFKIRGMFFSRVLFNVLKEKFYFSSEKNFNDNGNNHFYKKILNGEKEELHGYYLTRSFLAGDRIATEHYVIFRVRWIASIILRSYCFVFYGNGFWRFLETMLPFWLGLLALALSSFKFFSIII